MENLRGAYKKKELDQITLLYGFIALLHLANEKELIVFSINTLSDLVVRKHSKMPKVERRTMTY